jgi:hypothetical protein
MTVWIVLGAVVAVALVVIVCAALRTAGRYDPGE